MNTKPLLGPCDSITDEMWKDIPSYPGYQASDLGRIRSLDSTVACRNGTRTRKGKILAPVTHHSGYVIYTMYAHKTAKSEFGHVLVMRTFLGEAPGFVVCHHDGNKANNTLSNLRYDTKSANEQDKHRHGTYQQGEKNPRAKLTRQDVVTMRDRRAAGETIKNLALVYGFRPGHISKVCTGMLWKNTNGPLTREFTKNV